MMYRVLSRGKKNVQIRELSMAAYSFNAEGKKTTRLREMLEKKDLAFLMYVVEASNFSLSLRRDSSQHTQSGKHIMDYRLKLLRKRDFAVYGPADCPSALLSALETVTKRPGLKFWRYWNS